LFVVVDNYWAILMKNLTQSLERVAFSFSALSMMSAIELLNLSPAQASPATKTYTGQDANVTVTCVSVDRQSTGNFSIDGRKSGTKITGSTGFAYFDNNPRSAQIILVADPLGRSILSGDSYAHGLPANNFGALIAATGYSPNGSLVISLPDLSENPDKAFGYTVNCPAIPTKAGGDGSGGSGGVASGGGGSTSGGVASGGNTGSNLPIDGSPVLNYEGLFEAGPGLLCNSTMYCWRTYIPPSN
jgi:hypothetical protein